MRLKALALALVLAIPLHAQTWTGEMHQDLNAAQKKILDLAKAMPENSLSWRPGDGVRSVGEVFLHIAADNYYIGAMMGKPAPASTGITADMATAAAFEKRKLTRDQIVADLQASFTHIHQALGLTTEANASETIKFFGQDWTRMKAMVLTVTHIHEHLGQAIAYARMNKVVPPWSQ